MKPLIVLIVSFIITLIVLSLLKKRNILTISGKVALACMLVFTAIGHFAFTEGMSKMIPAFFPFKIALVYITGVFEFLIALALLIPKFSKSAGWVLIIMFLLFLPANIHASLNHINYQTGELTGNGPVYLWFRIPLQLLYIAWAYYFLVKNNISPMSNRIK